MRTLLRLTLPVVLLGTFAHQAHAGALNLRWNACWGDGGAMNRDSACGTNLGSQAVYGSVVPSLDQLAVSQYEASLSFAVAGPVLPPWWQFHDLGSCRTSALSVNGVAPPAAVHCEDWSAGGAITLVTDYVTDAYGPGSVRFAIGAVVPPDTPADLLAGHEYYLFTIVIFNQKTTGVGACAGCELGACMSFNRLTVIKPGGTDQIFAPNARSDDRLVTWQGGTGVISTTSTTATSCVRATPARNSTWSSVKALYR